MGKLSLTGGARLVGTVRSSGSKNSTLAIMAGALLGKGRTVQHNVPEIGDVRTMMDMLRALGVGCEELSQGVVSIDATDIENTEAPYELVKKMRASFCVLGPLLARRGYAKVAMPGGCDIGARPIDLHVKGIQALGAVVNIEHGFVEAEGDGLRGAQIYFNLPSAGATQHIMATACLAQGVTTIHNAAMEPEVVELCNLLTKMGANIRGAGTPTVRIEGVKELHGTEFEVVPDRMEAGTFAVATTMTMGDVTVENIRPDHIEPFVLKLREVGAIVDMYDNAMRVRCNARPMATDITTMPHPGFPTDLQQPFAAMLSIAQGVSIVTENVYERRFKYVNEIGRMGADIKQDGRTAVITGTAKLLGAPVTAPDLRGGAALICAGLAAEGQTDISGTEHVERGYENLTYKLCQLGAQIVSNPNDIERESILV
ncbi:MAG: UDP-N-acetylglucosamine 1-carboxyvinyltransferase [Armatimonadetes bacterium]|nr:UDP-N-acetylglucosamine 1-carboxyvinyltransferase [Armatimonadota bacterium]